MKSSKGFLSLENSLILFVVLVKREKKTRNTHKRFDEILTSKPLELLHMDLMGPMRTKSLGGKKCILVMVDDYSRYAWVAFINFKDSSLKIQNEKGYL